MNKVDLHVRRLLLDYPTLFKNRFDVFVQIFTTTGCGYRWDENGCPDDGGSDKGRTPDQMVAAFEKTLAEMQEKAEKDAEVYVLDGLNRRWIAEAEEDLIRARHVAANIDTYASEWTSCDYAVHRAWLWHVHRHGICKYWLINDMPENVDPEWRKAAADWLSQVLPSMTNLMGYWGAQGFEPIPEYAVTSNWVRTMFKVWDVPLSPELLEAQRKLAEEIVAEILAEEKAK